jgi:hypothetical protein
VSDPTANDDGAEHIAPHASDATEEREIGAHAREIRAPAIRTGLARIDSRERGMKLARWVFIPSSLACASSCAGAVAQSEVGILAFASGIAWLVMVVGVALFVKRWRQQADRAHILVTGGALSINERGRTFVIERDRIRSVWIEAGSCVNVVSSDGRALAIDMPSGPAARELVSELGFEKDSRVLDMPLAGAIKSLTSRRAIALLWFLPASMLWGIGAVFIGASLDDYRHRGDAWLPGLIIGSCMLFVILGSCIAAAIDTRARRVIVGNDGLRVPGRARTLLYSEIALAEPSVTGVRVQKKDGAWIELPLFLDDAGPRDHDDFAARQRILAERIESYRRGSELPPTDARLDTLDRAGRTRVDYVKALRALGDAPGGYRAAPVAPEDLERVIRASDATPERRIAATVALSAVSRERARDLVRVVTPTCVDEGLVRALEHAADEADFAEDFAENAAARKI